MPIETPPQNNLNINIPPPKFSKMLAEKDENIEARISEGNKNLKRKQDEKEAAAIEEQIRNENFIEKYGLENSFKLNKEGLADFSDNEKEVLKMLREYAVKEGGMIDKEKISNKEKEIRKNLKVA